MSLNLRGPIHAVRHSQVRELLGGYELCGIRELVARGMPHLPAGLFTAEARQRLRLLPLAFPPAVSLGAFECGLADDDGTVGFELCVRADGGGREALGGGLSLLGRAALSALGWRQTTSFLREWTQPGSLHDGVPAVCLRLGLENEAGDAPPLVLATLARDLGPRGLPRRNVMRAIERAQVLLSGDGVHRDVRDRLRICIENLPKGARLLRLGMRPSAPAERLRICVRTRREDLPAYLERIGWSGSPSDLQAWLERSTPAEVEPLVNLDLGREVEPSIGIEYSFDTSTNDPNWRVVLDALERDGGCGKKRRAQISAWATRSAARGRDDGLRIDRSLAVEALYQTGEALRARARLQFASRLDAALS